MTSWGTFQQRKSLFLTILFVAFFTFTADILDLREELNILSCPDSSLDNNITTGIISTASFDPEPIYIVFSHKKKESVKISFIHLLPYGFRAPPVCS
jgi:hypothetical protein